MRSPRKSRRLLVMVVATMASAAGAAAEPSLTVVAGGKTAIYTAAGLLSLPAATTVTVPADAAYKREMSFRAVPIATLLSSANADNDIRFFAGDRTTATIRTPLLLSKGPGLVVYLAIEPADAPWPPLKAGDAATAGPFYLVWSGSDKAAAAAAPWPYQISRIEELQGAAKRFPMLLPAARVAANHPIRAGFVVFQKQCMPCHTLNGGGDSTLGPDLNVPYNPTEYLRPEALRRLIRDPQSLRHWPQSKMPAFDAKTLPDHELAELLAYLRHMADRKVAPPATK
jgi:mono/diheme cytochrome c family protein